MHRFSLRRRRQIRTGPTPKPLPPPSGSRFSRLSSSVVQKIANGREQRGKRVADVVVVGGDCDVWRPRLRVVALSASLALPSPPPPPLSVFRRPRTSASAERAVASLQNSRVRCFVLSCAAAAALPTSSTSSTTTKSLELQLYYYISRHFVTMSRQFSLNNRGARSRAAADRGEIIAAS